MFTFHLCKVCALVSVSVFMLPVLFWRQCFVFSPLQKPKFKVSQYMFQQLKCTKNENVVNTIQIKTRQVDI